MSCFYDSALWDDAWAVLLGLAGALWLLGFWAGNTWRRWRQ